jgi:putative transposase
MPKRKNSKPAINPNMKPIVDFMVQKYNEDGKNFDMNKTVKELVGSFLQTILDTEMDNHLGHQRYERVDEEKTDGERKNYRNGTFPKTVKSNFGGIDLHVPRDRIGTFEPAIVPKGVRDISGIDEKIIRLYANGMTERDISYNLNDLYGIEYSAATISQITDKVIPLIKEWQNRPLQRIYAYVFVDAAYFNVRNPGNSSKKACYTAIGVNMQGEREVLGFWIGENESASYWCNVFQEIRARGTEDVLLFSIDGLTGMADAIHAVYPDAYVQRCLVHQMRNCFKLVAYKDSRELARDMKNIYKAPTVQAAEDLLDAFEDKWGKKYPNVINAWRNNWNELTTFYNLPIEMRRLVYTTNAIESYHRGIRKYMKNRSIFPDEIALTKLLYMAMVNVTRKWNKNIFHWNSILRQLLIVFPNRITPEDLEVV